MHNISNKILKAKLNHKEVYLEALRLLHLIIKMINNHNKNLFYFLMEPYLVVTLISNLREEAYSICFLITIKIKIIIH